MRQLWMVFAALILFSSPVISSAQDDGIGNEIDKAEEASGGEAQLDAPPAPDRALAPPPAQEKKTAEATTDASVPQSSPDDLHVDDIDKPTADQSSSPNTKMEKEKSNDLDAEAHSQSDSTSDSATDDHGSGKLNKTCNCRYADSTPYKVRRTTWGGLFGIQASGYQPTMYQPKFVSSNFANYYGGSTTPAIELVFGTKLNFALGSLAAQLSGGYFSASNAGDGSNFSVIPITLSATYFLDVLGKQPYVVPYATFGGFTGIYNETVGGLSFSGRSGVAPFYAAGLEFQLDWIDPDAHDANYEGFGIENTFVYIEARSFLASSDSNVANLSSPLQLGGGLKIEF